MSHYVPPEHTESETVDNDTETQTESSSEASLYCILYIGNALTKLRRIRDTRL